MVATKRTFFLNISKETYNNKYPRSNVKTVRDTSHVCSILRYCNPSQTKNGAVGTAGFKKQSLSDLNVSGVEKRFIFAVFL
jgi:hypothetical protein